MPNPTPLINELRSTLVQIEKQIDEIKKMIDETNDAFPSLHPRTIHNAQDQNGGYILTPLLLAKSNCLAAIANLQAARR